MGGINFFSLCCDKYENQKLELKAFYKDFRGQYNSYMEYSNFELNISKKTFNNNEIEIEGIFVDKKGKSKFTGKLTKTNITLDTRVIDDDTISHELIFQGEYNLYKKRYFGTFTKKNSKNYKGKFWIEVLENNFWMETGVTSKASAITYDTNNSLRKLNK